MRALRLTEVNTYPSLLEHPLPKPGVGEALVRIETAALNRRDLYITKGQYPGIQCPVTLGSDGYGEVIEAPDDMTDWIGEKVVLCPSLDWGDSEIHQGPNYNILGLPRDGTFAQYTIVPTEALFRAPSHLAPEQAAALPLAGLTAWRALMTRGCLRAEDRVLITGIGGGVALMAFQLAIAHHADAFVTSGHPRKLEAANSLGASGGALYTETDWHRALTKDIKGGFDLIIDGAGGEDFGRLVRVLNPGGRIVFYGGTRGRWPAILPQHLFFKQVSILASTMGSPWEFKKLLDYVGVKQIEPVVDQVFSLADAHLAFRRLESGRQFGKIVLSMDSLQI